MTHDELMDAYEAAWSGKDPAAFAALCTEDVHYEDPLLDSPIEGHAALAARARTLLEGFPDARIEPTGPRMISGRHVAAPCKIVATHRGDLGDALPATGRFVVMHAVFVCELHPERDLLWRVRAFFDVWGAGVQLGAVPARGTFAERAMLMLRGFGLRARS
jgi:steroid delta-isomerase-like uncharacterized protein